MKSKMQKSVEKQKATEKDFQRLAKIAEIALLNTEVGEVIDFDKMLVESSYGVLLESMKNTVLPYIKGKTVFDFGAGDLKLSKSLLQMGAKMVVAIDKELEDPPKKPTKGLKTFKGSFQDFADYNVAYRPGPNSIAFVSWPANHRMDGLLGLLARFNTVIYLGKNTDGSACAWPSFFQRMCFRPVLKYMPHRRNTLIIWGKEDPKTPTRPLFREERAGMDQSKCYSFEMEVIS